MSTPTSPPNLYPYGQAQETTYKRKYGWLLLPPYNPLQDVDHFMGKQKAVDQDMENQTDVDQDMENQKEVERYMDNLAREMGLEP